MRITVINPRDSSARDYVVGASALIDAVVSRVALDFGLTTEPGVFELVAMSGKGLERGLSVGATCREGGIYTVRNTRPA